MRLLLDSHVVLWWLDDNEALGSTCRDAIQDAHEVFVSVATPWELGIKQALGKLQLPGPITDAAINSGFRHLPIAMEHAELAPTLPPHHRDPFDRMLVAQAKLEALTLVTADSALDAYDVERIDART